MSYIDKVKEHFDKDIKEHTMDIIRDDGVHRHLRFSKGGSCFYQFDILTWPGYLCFTGDVGTYVFRRLEDMFRFFRGDDINLGYWHGKLEGVDQVSGSMNFSEDEFVDTINELYLNSWIEEHEEGVSLFSGQEEIEEVRASLKEMTDRVEHEYEAHRYGSEWSFTGAMGTFELDDLWECNFKRFTHRYVWCCYALIWAIKQYDKAKENEKTNIV